MRKRFIVWLIKQLLPGYSLHRNPGKRKGGEKDDRLDSSVHAEHGI